MTENGLKPASEGRFPIRVYYEDTDAGGIVYHANYLRFAERARTELLRTHGYDHPTLNRMHGMGFAVRRCSVDYIKPARLDDALEVRTTIAKAGAASIEMDQRIFRADEHIATVTVQLACIDGKGAPKRMPAALRQSMRSFEE